MFRWVASTFVLMHINLGIFPLEFAPLLIEQITRTFPCQVHQQRGTGSSVIPIVEFQGTHSGLFKTFGSNKYFLTTLTMLAILETLMTLTTLATLATLVAWLY